jgi:acyl transferase domain-containing protein
LRNINADQLCVLQCAYQAVEDAGITLSELHGTTTGVFVAGYTPFMVSGLAPS